MSSGRSSTADSDLGRSFDQPQAAGPDNAYQNFDHLQDLYCIAEVEPTSIKGQEKRLHCNCLTANAHASKRAGYRSRTWGGSSPNHPDSHPAWQNNWTMGRDS